MNCMLLCHLSLFWCIYTCLCFYVLPFCIMILLKFNIFWKTDIFVYHILLFIYLLLLFIHLLPIHLFSCPYIYKYVYISTICCPNIIQYRFVVCCFVCLFCILIMLLTRHFIYICFNIHGPAYVLKCWWF